ncbi:hypothetical protein niasHT_038582 [Heterodera trifolii]|uniref:Alpha-1,6-mannosyl-glycoprotein 2-beta-N-acetylglucosaminyltransferase n=1 Tax=Heterodera trifolii TaxID=157864 RepID=A0ABD2HYS0_9BILA
MYDFILRIVRPSTIIFIIALIFLLPFLFYVTFNATKSIYWQKIELNSVFLNSNDRQMIKPKNVNENPSKLDKLPNLDEMDTNLEWHKLLTNSSKSFTLPETRTAAGEQFNKIETISSSIISAERIDKFDDPNAENVDFVIIVQVHDRVKYLNSLIKSLSNAYSIERVLLVFSSDFHSEEINAVIRSIEFCRTLHINFPYSAQYYPKEFPGPIAKENEENRNAILAQMKHHWWWKLNYMFEVLMPKYGLNDKFLILLEEDHIVAPDFLHTLQLIVKNRKNICSNCEMLCLGTYPSTFANYAENINKLGVEVWFSSKNNLGLAVDRQLWRQIQNCAKLSIQCLPKRFEVIYTEAPRVIHVGDCGVHWHKCENDHRSLDQALDLFERVNDSFFPSKLEVSHVNGHMTGVPSGPNGGWADPRDHRLCELNTHPSADDNPAKILNEVRLAN